MLGNKWVLIGLIAVIVALGVISPAYANVMETSLDLRDKLPASTLADMPSFIEDYRELDSKVSFDSTGHYTIYNENDLRGIFGEDAVLVPSPPGLLTITYKRGGVYRFWGMLHGLVVADSARKAITLTKGGFISPEDVGVNIAGDEVVIDARNPARSAFKISRDGVYVQNEYFLGCEPEQEATAEDCLYEKCEKDQYGYEKEEEEDCQECTFEEMQEYEEEVERENYCELKAVAAPRYAYANVTGQALLSESAFLKDYKMQTPREFSEIIIFEAEGFLEYIGDLRNVQIEKGWDISFTASAPAGGDIDFRIGIKSSEMFRYSMKGDYKYLSGDRLEIYGYTFSLGIVVKAEDVGSSPHSESSIRIFNGPVGGINAPLAMEIKKGAVYFTEETACPLETGAFCFYKRTDFNEFGETSEYYQMPMISVRQSPLAADINTETISIRNYDMTRKDVLVEIGPFSDTDTSSKVRLVNNAGTAVEFTSSDIILTPPDRSWTELGVSFRGYVNPEEGIPQHEPDMIECRYNEGKCYLNGVEALGFIGGRVQRNRLCSNDEACGSDGKCVEGLCVKKAICEPVDEMGIGINGISGQATATLVSGFAGRNKANVIFISDGYDSKNQFGLDIQKVISTSAGSNGIFSVEPFKSNIGKFSFYSAFGGNAPSMSGHEGIVPWERYVNGIVKQCPAAEYAIVLTQKNFRAFASPWRTGLAEKGSAWVSVGAEPENFPLVALHEFGHSFGDLIDEYYNQVNGFGGNIGNPNCLSYDAASTKWGTVLADNAQNSNWKGCGGDCDSRCASLLRPSENSIMNKDQEWIQKRNEPGWKAFNPPSEAQVIEKLNAYF